LRDVIKLTGAYEQEGLTEVQLDRNAYFLDYPMALLLCTFDSRSFPASDEDNVVRSVKITAIKLPPRG
jgi:hypothetical protein